MTLIKCLAAIPPIHPFHFQKSISNLNKTQLINLCFTTHQSNPPANFVFALPLPQRIIALADFLLLQQGVYLMWNIFFNMGSQSNISGCDSALAPAQHLGVGLEMLPRAGCSEQVNPIKTHFSLLFFRSLTLLAVF